MTDKKEVRYKYLDEDEGIDERLQKARETLDSLKKAREDKKKEYISVQKQICKEQRKQEKASTPGRSLKTRIALLVAIALIAIAASGFYARYRYETKGTQIAEEELFICHTPGCSWVKTLHYDKMIYFSGVAVARKYGNEPCHACHQLIRKASKPYSPQEEINDRL